MCFARAVQLLLRKSWGIGAPERRSRGIWGNRHRRNDNRVFVCVELCVGGVINCYVTCKAPIRTLPAVMGFACVDDFSWLVPFAINTHAHMGNRKDGNGA
jgi:hypothetical protein